MVQRWIQENKRFLGGVIGAFLLLLIFNSFFVNGNWKGQRRAISKINSDTGKLKKVYNPAKKKGRSKSAKPLARTLKKVKQQRDEFSDRLKNEIALYGNAPAGSFILPGDIDTPDKAKNYFFNQRAIVTDELEQAAAANAVNVAEGEFGLGNPNFGDKPVENVRKRLWLAQLVRRAVGAAIASGVDSIEDVQLSGSLTERFYSDGGYRVSGIPFRVEVTGSAPACVAWLENLQDSARGYVVIVASKTARDGDVLGNVKMTADLMGMQHEVVASEEEEGE